MNSRLIRIGPLICLALLLLHPLPGLVQDLQETQDIIQNIQSPKESARRVFLRSLENRRDPFKDLMAVQQDESVQAIKDISQLSIDDVTVTGIVQGAGGLTAVINGPRSGPFYIQEGDRFLDGFVLTVQKKQVVLRKTEERGFPLKDPKDIIKDISMEADPGA